MFLYRKFRSKAAANKQVSTGGGIDIIIEISRGPTRYLTKYETHEWRGDTVINYIKMCGNTTKKIRTGTYFNT